MNMSLLRKLLTAALSSLVFLEATSADIFGHSGVVLHVDKHGHLSGHSTHYDYRFYPEKLLLPIPLVSHHNIIGHHHITGHHHHHIDEELQEALALAEGAHHGPEPYFSFDHHHHDELGHYSYH